jgi:UDP-N-acetylglucosamine acyltransferase
MSSKIHPSAIINPNSKIAQNVEIGPFASIAEDVFIEEGTKIMNGVFIGDGARIGKNCIIHPYAIISNDPQDIKFFGKEIKTTVEIGDNTVIREFVTIHRGTDDKLTTVVGKNCFILAYTHIGHDCLIGNNVIISGSTNIAGHCTIDDHAYIGGMTGFHQFTKIGNNAMVGAICAVNKDIPPYVLADGDPISYVKINVIGLKRRGFSSETIQDIENAYNIIYSKELNTTQAINKIKTDFKITPEIQSIISFIEGSSRGIVRKR